MRPGVGSYYAGNSTDGTRHVLIGVVSAGGAIALVATCDRDGFCDFDHDGLRLSASRRPGCCVHANAAWSVITAISDAEAFNMRTAGAGPSRTPRLAVLRSEALDVGVRLGLQVFSAGF